MGINSIVNVVISRQTTVVSRPGFGVPLLCGYHTKWAERVRAYSSLSAMVSDGFAITDPLYLMASALLSQEPCVPLFKIGRRALPPTMVVNCTPTHQNATTYTVQINTTPYTYLSDGSATVQEVVEGLAAAINAAAWQASTAYALGVHVANDTGKIYKCITAGTSAGSGGPTGTGADITDNTAHWAYVGPEQAVTATEDNAVLTLTADVAGVLFTLELSDTYQSADLWVRENVTTDPGIATDLAAIYLENSDWYGLLLDSESKAEIVAAATWVETNKRLMLASSGDTACTTTATSDVISTLKTAARLRTSVGFHPKPHQYFSAAWMGEGFPKDVGRSTFYLKTLSGIDAVALTETQIANVKAKNGNVYITTGGVNGTQDGKTASPEWIDVVRDLDWLHANLQADVFALLANVDKLPYDQGGITLVQATVQARLNDAVARGILRADPAPVVVAPKLSEISAASRAARILPNITFTAYLAGAIQIVDPINGVVSI